MKQITFGTLKSYDDLHLILASKEIGSPKEKKTTITIEGADGQLDLTEFFGSVKYDNRTLKFSFSSVAYPFADHYSMVLNALHGKKVHITLDEDPNWYYVGRLSVSPYTSDKNIGKIDIEADCEPYKYKQNETVVSKAVSGSATIILHNSRMKAIPTIKTTAPMQLAFGGVTTKINAGTFLIPTLELVEGDNTVVVTGTGTVTFSYREGGL